jgi:hypothetical protein
MHGPNKMTTLSNDLREIMGVCESLANIVSDLKIAKLKEEPTVSMQLRNQRVSTSFETGKQP